MFEKGCNGTFFFQKNLIDKLLFGYFLMIFLLKRLLLNKVSNHENFTPMCYKKVAKCYKKNFQKFLVQRIFKSPFRVSICFKLNFPKIQLIYLYYTVLRTFLARYHYHPITVTLPTLPTVHYRSARPSPISTSITVSRIS